MKMDFRAGIGFDVHRFGPGSEIMLCGVAIPFHMGLVGHSDSDVGIHAICDAIYGALAEGDIGTWFPPEDSQWKNADSATFLRHAVERAEARGYSVSSMDCSIICEEPKIKPLATAMRSRLSYISGVETDRISVKATTTETLGFTGRKEGIAALATVALVKP